MIFMTFSILCFIFSFFLSITMGSLNIHWMHLFLDSTNQSILNFRISLALQATIVGGSLAVAGFVLQKTLRNPLADPFILGISAGGTFSASVFVVLSSYFYSLGILSNFWLPMQFIFTFLGSFLAFLILVFLKNKIYKSLENNSLIVIGIVLNSLFASLSILLMEIAEPTEIAIIQRSLIGQFIFLDLNELFFIFIVFFPLPIFFILKYSKLIPFLEFGNPFTHAQGISPHLLQKRVHLSVCCLIGGTVCLGGSIGFVGLMVPHIVKMMKRKQTNGLQECCLCFIWGSNILLWANSLSRSLISSHVFPIGAFTAILGAIALTILMTRKKHGGLSHE